ncbi:MAG: four helix bundle protein [Bacteroidia bacterium]|nr:four helix bundle protein [Bacteroidia bacterium]
MALYYELPVYRDTYKLILLIFQYTKNFGREYKYTLGQDMKRDAMVLVRGIYRANKSKDKQEYLETLLDDFELLKLQIRLCHDLKLMNTKQMAEISLLTDSIGKQTTAWKNKNS